MDIAQLADRLTAETAKIIYGKETQIRLIVMALLSQGHVLLEDLPGVGKTTLIKTLAAVSGCRSKRIQFVPDLLPADILGMNIYDRNRGSSAACPAPCSPICCWPTRSTGRSPALSPPCWRPWKSGRSPSTARPFPSPPPLW